MSQKSQNHDANMASSPSQTPPRSQAAHEEEEHTLAAVTITAKEEITRFAHRLEFKTRPLRNSIEAYIGANPTQIEPAFNEVGEDEDEDLFVDLERFDDEFTDWVAVTNDATDLPEDRSTLTLATHATLPTLPRPTPIGPIQHTTLATRRAALQALGFTGTYLEAALRRAAEDVGWLTHTATFEEGIEKCISGVRKVRERFPVIGRVEESFGRGAGRGSARLRARRSQRFGDGGGDDGLAGASSSSIMGGGGRVVERLGDGEIARFGELEEAPVENDGEEWEEFPFAIGEE